jgi:hypothetical protein
MKIGGNPEAWHNYDGETSPSGDQVHHGAAAWENVKAMGDDIVGAGESLWAAARGQNILADGNRSVDGVGHYMANAAMALFAAGVMAPIALVKDASDTAVHGVLAGFQQFGKLF